MSDEPASPTEIGAIELNEPQFALLEVAVYACTARITVWRYRMRVGNAFGINEHFSKTCPLLFLSLFLRTPQSGEAKAKIVWVTMQHGRKHICQCVQIQMTTALRNTMLSIPENLNAY